MGDTSQNQWSYVGGAVLLHVFLAGGLYLLAMSSSPEPVQAPQLAIQAFVVQKFAPPTPRVDPTPRERERLAAEQLIQEREKAEAEREKAEREQQEREQQREKEERDAATAKQVEAQQAREVETRREQARAEEARAAAVKREREVAEREAAERKLDAERRRKEAEQQKLVEIQRQREAAERQEQEAREAEFKANLAAEDARTQVVNSGKMNEYLALIEQSIESKWIRPESARSGLECEVKVSQAESGTVLSVRIGTCNGGDTAVKQSIEAAVYRASPLPLPPDPRLFDRNLRVFFRPRD